MSDYSSFSMGDLEILYKYANDAYNNFQCPAGTECIDCCARDVCNALDNFRSNILSEIVERQKSGGSQ